MAGLDQHSTPGHIGRVVQPISDLIRGARLAAIVSSDDLARLSTGRRDYAQQVLPMLGASTEQRSTVDLMARVAAANARINPRQPGLAAFDFAFRPGR